MSKMTNESSLTDDLKKLNKTEETEIAIENMPLNSLADYIKYNDRARKANHKLRICRYPIKPCPVELHPTQRVIFTRKDQPTNPLPAYKSDHMIDFKMMLYPNKTYDLPLYIIDYLSQKGTAIWGWVDEPDGSRETKKVGMDPRFAIRTVWSEPA